MGTADNAMGGSYGAREFGSPRLGGRPLAAQRLALDRV